MKTGITKDTINNFSKKYGMYLPKVFQNWLTLYNGGEIFALPVGTTIAGILGDNEREKGVFYIEDNFDEKKRYGIPNNLFIIAELCDGEIIGFDLNRSTKEDGVIIQWDSESAQIIDEWDSFVDWLHCAISEGNELFDYEGNEKFP